MRSGCALRTCRGVALAAGLTLAAGLSPARAQLCTTEVFLYVDKTESINARETARDVLDLLNDVPSVTSITMFGFTGAVPVSTFAGQERAQQPGGRFEVRRLLDTVILQEPSSAYTLAPDYLALFEHVEKTAEERPTIADLRVYLVISDFSMRRGEAGHESGLPVEILARLASLRRTLVARGNQRLLALRTPPRQEPSPALHNSLVGEIARRFALTEETARIPGAVAEVLSGEPPLLLELSFDPATAVYDLTVGNPSCTPRPAIEYHAIAAGIDAKVALPGCPAALRPGETGSCKLAPAQVALPPLPDTCLNVWLRAHESPPPAAGTPVPVPEVAPVPAVLGTANDPILLGNCIFLSRVDLDTMQSLATVPDLADCRRAAEAAAGTSPVQDPFVACLGLRGRVEGDAARLRVRRGPNATAPLVVDRRLRESELNGAAFHGGERLVPVGFSLPWQDASWLCSPEVDPAERRLAVEIVGTGGVPLASGLLGRVLPPAAEDPLALWRKLLIPLLLLLLVAGPVANYRRTASIGALDAVLLVVGLGLFALLFAAYGGSGFGAWLTSLLGSASLWVATCLLALLLLAYWLLFTKGFFDRQLTAEGKASLTARVPLAERRRRRSRRTLLVVGVVLAAVAATLALLWLDPREVSECRYHLTDLPANTPVPPFSGPTIPAAPAPTPAPTP